MRTRSTTAVRAALALALVLSVSCAPRHVPSSAAPDVFPATAAPVFVPCASADCLRILTWNLHGIPLLSPSPPARFRNVAAKLREQQPDVVFLQEVWSWAYARQLARDLPAYRLVAARGCWRPFPCGGLVILVRNASGWRPSAPTFVPYDASAPWYRFREWDGIVKKGVLTTTLTGGDATTLGIVDTHLQTEYAYLGRDYADLRRQQFEQLDGILRARFDGRPVVIGGDFNTGPEEHSGLYASRLAHLGTDRTVTERRTCHCGTRPPGSYRVASRWLDYVLTRGIDARATTVRITNEWVDRPYSDHDAVLVRLDPEHP